MNDLKDHRPPFSVEERLNAFRDHRGLTKCALTSACGCVLLAAQSLLYIALALHVGNKLHPVCDFFTLSSIVLH